MSRGSRRTGYEPEKFIPYVEQLLVERNETAREASLRAGLDRSALWRFIKKEMRPHRDACILLAQHFEVNPNEMLQAAGYDPIPLFNLSLTDPNEYPPEVKAVAQALTRIENAERRRTMCEAVGVLIDLAVDSTD